MEAQKPKRDVMHDIAVLIIRYRFVIMLLFVAAAVYCGLSLGKVKVSSELTIFLSEQTETRRGLHIMEDSFIISAPISLASCSGLRPDNLPKGKTTTVRSPSNSGLVFWKLTCCAGGSCP